MVDELLDVAEGGRGPGPGPEPPELELIADEEPKFCGVRLAPNPPRLGAEPAPLPIKVLNDSSIMF